jgi:hypothetical protein
MNTASRKIITDTRPSDQTMKWYFRLPRNLSIIQYTTKEGEWTKIWNFCSSFDGTPKFAFVEPRWRSIYGWMHSTWRRDTHNIVRSN